MQFYKTGIKNFGGGIQKQSRGTYGGRRTSGGVAAPDPRPSRGTIYVLGVHHPSAASGRKNHMNGGGATKGIADPDKRPWAVGGGGHHTLPPGRVYIDDGQELKARK